MPIYAYKCTNPACDGHATSTTRASKLDQACGWCGTRPMQRVWKLGFEMPMQEHFNQSVGKPISSMRQYRDELKRKSEIASETTGIEHRYVPVDMNDRAALGVTNEGIAESNAHREKIGEKLLPELT